MPLGITTVIAGSALVRNAGLLLMLIGVLLQPLRADEAAAVAPQSESAPAAKENAAAIPTPEPSKPDNPQALLFEAYSTLAAANNAADERAAPSVSRFDLYLGQNGLLSRRLVQSLQYTLDDGAAQLVALSPAQASVLADHGDNQRVARLPLADGAHRLHIELRLAASTDGKSPAKDLKAEYSFEKLPGELTLTVLVETGTVLSPQLRVRRLLVAQQPRLQVLGVGVDVAALVQPLTPERRSYYPGEADDPALAYARYLGRLGDHRAALIELLAVAERTGSKADPWRGLAVDHWLETSRQLREVGLLDRAEALCDRLAALKSEDVAVAVERLHLGEARFSSGDLSGAEWQLQLARPALPEFQQPDWRHAMGLVQLARQQAVDAGETLKVAATESIDAFRYMNSSLDAVRATSYSRYNLAVAMLRSGDEKHGLSWLDLIGRSDQQDPELLALRDQANLALGWHFLRERQGRTALGVLGRIRSEGLSANSALLGMGWAQLAPAGQRLPRAVLNPLPPRAPDQIGDLPAPIRNSLTRLRVLEPELSGGKIGPRSFEREDPPKDRREGLRRALGIWGVLIERDERYQAVQEARLAIAYAHDQLHNGSAARAAYNAAIDSLRRVDAGIDADLSFVSSGEMKAALAGLQDREALFGVMDRLHLEPEPASAALYATLEQLEQWTALQAALVDVGARLASAEPTASPEPADPKLIERIAMAETALSTEREALVREAQASAEAGLNARKTITQDYLKKALLLLARLEDAPELESR